MSAFRLPVRVASATIWVVTDAEGRTVCEAGGPDEAEAIACALNGDAPKVEGIEKGTQEQTKPAEPAIPPRLDRFGRKIADDLATLLALEYQNSKAAPTAAADLSEALYGAPNQSQNARLMCERLEENGLSGHAQRNDIASHLVNEYWITDLGRERIGAEVSTIGLYPMSPKSLYAYRLVRELLGTQNEDDKIFVYFVECPQTRLFKIGCTGSPLQRMKGLQTMSAAPLRIVGIFQASSKQESELHWIFGSFRKHGEWFERWGAYQGDYSSVVENVDELIHMFDPLFSMHRATADEVQRVIFDPCFPEQTLTAEEGLS